MEPPPNIERELAGPRLCVKRDDTRLLAFGGSKAHQFEFHFGEAREQGADTVLITGAVQSNCCRTRAAFAVRFGATPHTPPFGEDKRGVDARSGTIAAGPRTEGHTPIA